MKVPIDVNIREYSPTRYGYRVHPDGWTDTMSYQTQYWLRDIRSGGDSPAPRVERFKGAKRKVKTIDRKTGKAYSFWIREPNPYTAVKQKRKLTPNAYNRYWYVSSDGTPADHTAGDGWRYLSLPFGGTSPNGDYALSAYEISAIPYAPWDSNDDLKLLDALREQLRGSDFDLGVFLGEGHESLKLIGDTARRIYGGLYALKHNDIRGAIENITGHTRGSYGKRERKLVSRPYKTAADNWLALQYGWLPLLSDVHAAAEFLAARMSKPCYKRYVARRKSFISDSDLRVAIEGLTIKNGAPDWRGASVLRSLRRKQIVAYVSEKQTEVDKASLSSLVDPLTVAWELTPYSFVADWFVPIGTYLANRSFFGGLTGQFVTSTFYERNITNPRLLDTTFFGYTRQEGSFSRVVTSSLDVPMPSVKPLSKAASWQHAANALALVTGFFKT